MNRTLDNPMTVCNLPAPSARSSVLRVPFGLKDGRMWTPRQVSMGKACGCTCPACGGPLIGKALASRRRRPHFAHLRDSNCRAGFETAVHLKAKQLIADELCLWLPAWDGSEDMPNPSRLCDDAGFFLTGRRVEFPAREAMLTEAVVEQHRGDYIPDLVARDEQGELLIEIRVTHAVDELKRRRIQSEGRRMVEIDLRLKPSEVYDEARFRHCVLEDLSRRHWLSCPPATDAWRENLQELKAALIERNREIAERRAQERERLQAEEATRLRALTEAGQRQQRREQFRQQLRTRYESQLTDLPELVDPDRVQGLMDTYWQAAAVEVEQRLAELPEDRRKLLLPHHSNGWIYGVHPALWQVLAYCRFVHGRPLDTTFNQRDVAAWVLRTFPKEQALYDLFVAQYRARADARNAGFHKRRISFWAFTAEENALIPDFYMPVNHFVRRLLDARIVRGNPGAVGKFTIAT